jgi:hypothetical protein
MKPVCRVTFPPTLSTPSSQLATSGKAAALFAAHLIYDAALGNHLNKVPAEKRRGFI